MIANADTVVARDGRNKRVKATKYINNYIGLFPFLCVFFLFMLWPMIYGIVMSFTSWSININAPTEFVGLDNYKRLLIGDGLSAYRFKKSMTNLLFYILFTIPIGILIAVAVALIVNSFSKKAYHFFRGAFFLPTAVPLFLGAGVWLWLFTSDTGLVSALLGKLGIGSGIIWKNSKGYAIAMCVIVDVWRSVGFNMVLLTAGMKGIPREYYEAARVDGASVFQIMRKITLPLLEPILFFIVVNGFISALQVYSLTFPGYSLPPGILVQPAGQTR